MLSHSSMWRIDISNEHWIIFFGEGCNDTDPLCETRASLGECISNRGFMLKACPLTCGICLTLDSNTSKGTDIKPPEAAGSNNVQTATRPPQDTPFISAPLRYPWISGYVFCFKSFSSTWLLEMTWRFSLSKSQHWQVQCKWSYLWKLICHPLQGFLGTVFFLFIWCRSWLRWDICQCLKRKLREKHRNLHSMKTLEYTANHTPSLK